MYEDPDEHYFTVFKNIYESLKPNSQFIFSNLNPYREGLKITQQEIDNRIFDPVSMTKLCVNEDWNLPEGAKVVPAHKRKIQFPPELK